MDQLKSEINRIADSANFNGIKLLDGSLDEGAVTGVSYNKVDSKAIIGLIPETGKPQDQPSSVDKDKTVVETDSTVPASKAGFEINLEGVSVTAGEGEKFTLSIGDSDLVADLEAGKTYTAKDLADLIVETYKDKGLEGFGDGDGGDFTITAEGSTLKFVSDTDVKLNTKADVTWKVDDGTTPPEDGGNGTKAKLEATVTIDATANAVADGDTIKFDSDGGTALDLTATATVAADGTTTWAVTGAPTGYTATFDGSKLTIEADAASDVADNPFGDIGLAAGGTYAGTPTVGATTFTKGVAAEDGQNLIDPQADTPSEMGGALADATVGGTPAKYTAASSQVTGITVEVDAATATAGDVKVAVSKASADKAAQATGADKLAGLTFKTADTVGRAGNDINIKIVASGATGTATAAWDKDTNTVTVTLTSDGGNSGAYDVSAIQTLIAGLGDKTTDGGINFTNFTVSAANSEKIAASDTASAGDLGSVKLAGGESQNDMTVTLTSQAGAFSKTYGSTEWTGTVTVDGDKGVTAEIDTTKVTATVAEATVGTVSAAVGGKAITLTTLEADAIKEAADGTTNIADGKVTIEKNANGKLDLKIGDKVIGTSVEDVPTSSSAATDITFTTDGTAQGDALGKITLASGLVANDITEAIETGLTYTAATSGEEPEGEYIPSTNVSGDLSQNAAFNSVDSLTKDTVLDATQVTALKTLFDGQGSGSGKILVGTTGVEVDLAGVTDGAAKVSDIATKIMEAAKKGVDAYNAASTDKKYEVVGVSADQAGTVWLAGGPAENNQALTATDGFYIQLKEVEDEPDDNTPAAPVSGGTINSGIQNVTTASAGETPRLANTVVDFNNVDGKTAWTDGAKITIGDTVYTVAVGDDSKFKNAKNVVHLSNEEADSKDMNLIAAEKLTHAAANNSIFSVGHDGKGGTTLQQRTAVKNTTDMSTREKIANYLGVSLADTNTIDNAKTGDGLTLQIGDTSESFNQLKVSIGDMHVDAMNLGDVRIDNQTSAAAAISAIKNAINYVSGVRGDLGATQNRLEHTANNLSVMTENIQDAESTIRDTDIAEEMMAYTKNNILVQSAQAMLAQANQVPQGVLQLLG
jgi:flagellin-like hook-associated protein FlgL